MKTGYVILSAASIVSLLSSCATYQKTADSEAWHIKPTVNVRHSAETPESFYQLGRYYQGQNRYELAMRAYQKALEIDSGYVEARNGMAVIYAMQGRQQEAIEQLRLAMKQAPNAAHIHNNLGYVLYLSGANAEAASTLERAVALDPANQAARTNLALALEKAGDSAKAWQVMAGVPQQPLALPKDSGVITQAERKTVPMVESHIQAVQLAPNVYELRERVKEPVVHAAAVAQAPRQALTLPKDGNALKVAVPQPVSVAESPVQPRQPVSKKTEQQARAAAPASAAAKPFRIEVSNGNGVTGMARKVANYLDAEGYAGARLTNQKPFRVTSSQVQYRAGYREQAQSLVSALPGHSTLVQANDLRGDISVRVVLGKDLTGNVAYFERDQGKMRVALKGPAV